MSQFSLFLRKNGSSFLSQKQCFPTTDFVVCALIPLAVSTQLCYTYFHNLIFHVWLHPSMSKICIHVPHNFFYQLSTLPIFFQAHLFPLRFAYWRFRILNDDLWFLYKTLTTNLLWSHFANLCSILNPSQYLFSPLTETFPLSSYHHCNFYSISYGT